MIVYITNYDDWKAQEKTFDSLNFQLGKLKSPGWFGDLPIPGKGTLKE